MYHLNVLGKPSELKRVNLLCQRKCDKFIRKFYEVSSLETELGITQSTHIEKTLVVKLVWIMK